MSCVFISEIIGAVSNELGYNLTGRAASRGCLLIAWHWFHFIYCLVAPITTMSGWWQNNHSNTTHPIVLTAFETCTGNFTRHNAEWGRPLVWPSLSVSVMDKLCGWARSSALPTFILSLLYPKHCLGSAQAPSGPSDAEEQNWKQLWELTRFPSSTSYSRIPRGHTGTVWSDLHVCSPIARVSHPEQSSGSYTDSQPWRGTQSWLHCSFWIF